MDICYDPLHATAEIMHIFIASCFHERSYKYKDKILLLLS